MKLYIDPGTGSMLFTVLVAVLGSVIFLLRGFWIKLQVLLGGGRQRASADREPLVIFSEGKRYWQIFEPICEALEKRGQQVLYLTESADDPALEKGYQHIRCQVIGEGNRAFARLNVLKARVVLSTTPGLDVYQWKRSRDVDWYVHIAHAPGDITRYRMLGLDFYDAVLLSGEYQVRQIRQLEQLRELPEKELVIVGLPYMDEAKRRLEAMPRYSGTDGRTILLAPSWGPSAILSRYGGRMLDALLATGYHVIIRPHPQCFDSEKALMEELMKAYPDSDRLEWNRDRDNFEVLRRSDILISDFSGVMFDFALIHDKPVLYADTAFDNGLYDAYWLPDPLWTFQVLPTLGRQVTEEMLPRIREVIDECIDHPGYAEAREKARQETWMYRGEGAERAAEYLIRKLNELKEADAEQPQKNPERGSRNTEQQQKR